MKIGSLFAGIGGFDIAAERAGLEIAFQSEIDQYSSKTLDHHWPDIPNHGDIHDIRGDDLPAVQILAGGFPCQDYSVAGKRAGLAGDRGALWWQYHRLIAELNPTWIVGENVAGLIHSRGGKDFETIVRSLTELGYGVVWTVLDAQYFGVAQRRRRVFIVGHSGGQPRPEVLALSEGLFGHPEPSRKAREEATNALTASFGTGGSDTAHAEAGWLIGFNSAQDPTHYNDLANPLDENSRASQAIAFAANQRDEVRDLDNLAGALAADPGMKQQTFVAESTVRRLTPLECERLQGFPDNWTKVPGVSPTQRYKQLGNAVAVPVAEWILRRIERREK